MATRKDLLKAHSFFSQRMVSALVNRNPDDQQPPLRKVATGTFIGILVSVLILAGFGVVGMIRPGNSKSWKQDGTIVIDSGSGQVMVYLADKLYPTFNITSARLAAGGADKVKTVKSKSLRGVPRENPIGIPRAPSELPEPEDLSVFPLRVCSVPDADPSGSPFTTVEMGHAPDDEPPPIPDNTDFIARSDGENPQEYLIIDGVAHQIPDHAITIHLGFGETATVAPGNAWLRALPQGPKLSAPEMPGAGGPSLRPVPGMTSTVGELFKVEGGVRPIYYVLGENGLSEIAPLEAMVMEATGDITATPISAEEARGAIDRERPSMSAPGMPTRLPDVPTDRIAEDTTMCAIWNEGKPTPTLVPDAPTPPVSEQNPDPNVADRVVMPSLAGALVRVDSSVGGEDPGVLITNGRRYGIADMPARGALGYGEVQPVPVSAQVLRLIPEGLDAGQSLSIEAAIRPT